MRRGFQIKKTKYSENRIIAAVKQLESGRQVKRLARAPGADDCGQLHARMSGH
jgi:hypothetical protein